MFMTHAGDTQRGHEAYTKSVRRCIDAELTLYKQHAPAGALGHCNCDNIQLIHTTDKERSVTLRKHAYSNILKILPPKNKNFQIKNSDIFHISTQNIDCRYSLEPPR